MKIPRKCHNHEGQPCRDMKRRRDEEQIRTTQTRHMKPQTNKQRRTTTEEPPSLNENKIISDMINMAKR